MSNALLPCPFCGGEAKITARDVEPQGDPWYGKNIQTFVICTNCGACLFDDYFHDGFTDERKAISVWNRRADHIRDTTKKVSNADRIRSMSDEELAWFINLSPEMEFEVCLYCANGNTVPGDRGICLSPRGVCVANDRRDAFLEWLKQPVKEELI